jgi:hypothetical protein
MRGGGLDKHCALSLTGGASAIATPRGPVAASETARPARTGPARTGSRLAGVFPASPRQPPQIHAVSGERAAKFWLEPVELANSKRLSASEIAVLHRLVTKNRDTFLEAWHAHFDA